MDFGKEDRNKVLQFVISKYGQERVVALGAFQYIWAKGAIKDIGRVLGIPFEVTNEMTSQLDKESIKEVIELGLLDKYVGKYPELFEYAERLAGLPKSFGAHPCGKCCCVQETVYYNATDINEDGEYILQGDMHTAEDLGLIKADFLGLRTVDVIYDVLDMIGKDYQYIAPHNLDFNDKIVWESFRKGFTSGIFQFESGGMRDTLKKIDCSCIEDLSTANALFRPGSMKFIDNYANRKMGKEEITYIHKDLEQILKNSYGIIVYQEQLIEIGRLAKLSNPDKLRKATAKKNSKLLAEIQPELYSGLAARGWSQEQLDKLWDTMLDFAKYSFNKCVSGSTILIKPSTRKDRRNPTVEEMYKIVHDLQFAKDNNFLPLRSKYFRLGNYGTALSMFDDGRVRKNTIIDIQKSGVRDVFRVTTKSGRFIECTDNHKFPTPNGVKLLSELSVGDSLYIMGDYKHEQRRYNFTNGNFESNLPKLGERGFQNRPDGESVKFHSYIEECKSEKRSCEVCGCQYDETKRFEMHHKNKDRTDNETGNLQWCCVSCHKKLDYKIGRTKQYEKGIEVVTDKIVSIEFVRTEMTYDVTMDDPAHNFVANNGLITCNSHSSAYAIIAYICMYLKTYHPKEFMSAWINSISGDIDSVAECIEEARRLNIKIYIGDFNECSPITKVYKDGIMMGTNTFKYCNSNIANELMNLSQNNKYNNFIQLLDDINDKTSITSRQLAILAGLNYFHMFGKNQYLLNIIKYYNGIKEKDPITKKDTLLLPALRTCKQIKKEKIESYASYGLTKYIVEKYAGKETEKQYSQLNNVGILMELTDRLKNEPMPFYDYIKFEKEFLNYITYFNPTVADYYYLVADFKTLKDETKPYLVLRRICNGEEIKTRIKQSKIFKQNPFGEFSVLEIHDFVTGYKKKPVNGKWVTSDEEELLLEEYSVINNLLV